MRTIPENLDEAKEKLRKKDQKRKKKSWKSGWLSQREIAWTLSEKKNPENLNNEARWLTLDHLCD